MQEISLDIASTVAISAVFLVIGEFVKKRIPFLEKFFIPGAVVGGLIFSFLTLLGYYFDLFNFNFNGDIRTFLLQVFFTTIGFSASLTLLRKGGLGVFLFLIVAIVLLTLQNVIGVSLATLFGIHPFFGLAGGSVALTGGHGTSAAFGPLLEAGGAIGATPAAIAASTWGLVFGCLIGGPVGIRLLRRYQLKPSKNKAEGVPDIQSDTGDIKGDMAFRGTILVTIAIGLGAIVIAYLKQIGVVLPIYIGPMLIAAVMRNLMDYKKWTLPAKAIDTIGNISLSFFLIMALMSMKLWELASVAGPLLVILIIQTVFMAFYAYFVTFRVMGKDYDAAVMAAGHCGFGLGATPNAMANMEAFTSKQGPSPKAFFIVPLVGALFIDFFNAAVITTFIGFLR